MSDELSANPFLRSLRPDMRPGAILAGLQPYEAVLVPTASVFAEAGVSMSAISEQFLRNHVVRNLKKRGRKMEFVTVAGKKGSFAEDFSTITVNDVSFKVLRRISPDLLRDAFQPGSASVPLNVTVDVFVIAGCFHPLEESTDSSLVAPTSQAVLGRYPSSFLGSGGGGGSSNMTDGPRASFVDSDPQPATTFRDFQDKLADKRLKPIVKMIKPFLNRVVENAHGTNAIRVGHEEVRNFVSTTSEELLAAVEVWGENMSGDALREDMERYVMLKLYDNTFVSDPLDAEFSAKRDAAFSAQTLDPNSVGHNEAHRKSWHRALEIMHSMNTYRCPRDKLVCLLNTHAVIRSMITTAVRGVPASSTVDSRTVIEQALPYGIRICVLQQTLPNLVANLTFIEHYRSRSKLNAEAIKALDSTRQAVQYWLSADNPTATDDLNAFNDTLQGGAAPASLGRTSSQVGPLASSSTTTRANGGAMNPSSSLAAMPSPSNQTALRSNSFPAQQPPQQQQQQQVSVVQQGQNDSGRETGVVGRLPLNRIDIVDEVEDDARSRWDAQHAAALEGTATEWEEEQRRRDDAERELAALDADWLAAQSAAQQQGQTRSALLDGADVERLSKWEEALSAQALANETAFQTAKRAWSQLSKEAMRTYDVAEARSGKLRDLTIAEQHELSRRAETQTAVNRQISQKLTEAQARLDGSLQAFDETRRRHQDEIEERRASVATMLRDGEEQNNRRAAELEERERNLEERRAQLDLLHAKRVEELRLREEQLAADAEAAARRIEQKEADSLELLNLRIETAVAAERDAKQALDELADQRTQFELIQETSFADLDERRAAIEAYAAEVRAALAAEIKAVEVRVQSMEANSLAARQAAESRLTEVKRQSAVIEANLKDRAAALDRRQTDLERRLRTHATTEEKVHHQHQLRADELKRRAAEDRAAIADIQANLKAKEAEIDAAARVLEQRRLKIEAACAAREQEASERVRAMRAHCKSEFDTAVQVLAETDAVHAVADFHNLRMSDLENLWSTMRAFRKVKTQFNEVIAKFVQEDSEAEAKEKAEEQRRQP